MKVIVVSGKAQHGKDTAGTLLQANLRERGYKTLLIHYADALKYICKTYFNWNGEKDVEGRTLLQRVGTDVIRAQDPSFWVDEVIHVLKFFPDEWDYVIIPDCRFPNEIYHVRSFFDTIHIRVKRGSDYVSPLTEEQQNHISETALDNEIPNHWLINDGDISDLNEKICELLDNGVI